MTNPSLDTLDCGLLVTRILFHSFLLALYPVFTVYAFSFSNIFALLGLAIFMVIILLLVRYVPRLLSHRLHRSVYNFVFFRQ